jgi:hypothetical protein
VIVGFPDIGGINGHHCLSFLLIITNEDKTKTQQQKLKR